MTFKLPDLPYAYDALAPYMSRETLEYHHDKHHKAYVDNGNKLLEGSGLEGKSLEDIVKGAHGKNAGLFNNAGQHYNHLHFWQWLGSRSRAASWRSRRLRTVKIRWSTARRRSSAAMCGNTLITSTIAIAVPTI